MTKDIERIKDLRSTGRKRARALLIKLVQEGEREYKCIDCGHVPSTPMDVKTRSGDFLDADHENKNWADNDPANVNWRCRPCHYKKDRATEKGVSSIENEFGYDL